MDDTYCPVHEIECNKVKTLEDDMKRMVTMKFLSILIALFCIVVAGIFGVLSTQLSAHIDSSNAILKEISDRQHKFNTKLSLIMYKLKIEETNRRRGE